MAHILNKTTFVVGKNALDNWNIIKKAEREHYWVHANGIPSTHVIIEIDQPLQEEIQFACNLCKEYTKITNKNIRYSLTQVQNLKFGSKHGEVYFKDPSKVQMIQII
jgi:predicted ribosome quality control (RQC) complex YloA/Tae2 family protein